MIGTPHPRNQNSESIVNWVEGLIKAETNNYLLNNRAQKLRFPSFTNSSLAILTGFLRSTLAQTDLIMIIPFY